MKEYTKRVLKVLIYIEDHIQDEITVKELAQVACYSVFHFQRIFRLVVGESVYQYVKRLRMERAIAKLHHSGQSISDIALDLNFETQSSFTKAFKQCVGENPRGYRSLYKEINAIENKIKNLSIIQPKEIKQMLELPVLFIRRTGNYDVSAKDAWNVMTALIKDNNLKKAKLRRFSIAHDDPKVTDEEKLRFDACIKDDQRILVKGEVTHKIIPGGKYVSFIHRDRSETLDNVYDRIFFKWLPDSNESLDERRSSFVEHIDDADKIYVPLV